MSNKPSCDEDLIRRLPLPLAQLYRRAHNAKTPLAQHLTAFYLWEAALKLFGSLAIVSYAERESPDPEVAARLENLARPALGHWWEFVRILLPPLAEAGDAFFHAARDLILGRTRADLPRAAGLDAALREALDGTAGARATVRLNELFDRLIRYRNREMGHGAAGQRNADFYEDMARALLAGVAELLGRLDVLAGRRLVYVADVRRQPSGAWLIERYLLQGETARRLESLEWPHAEAARLPQPGRLYLEPPPSRPPEHAADRTVADSVADSAATALLLHELHPLAVYDAEAEEVFFFNARRGRQRVEYLCYTTGRTLEQESLAGERRALLATALEIPEGASPPPAGGAARDLTEAGLDSSDADRSEAEGGGRSKRKAGEVPRHVGEFELLSELGRGGMGVVYRAWQPSLGRQVALKCMFRAGDPKAEARFAREIRALGRVEHPHVIKIFTSGAEGDHWFYAMELVEGATLSAVADRLGTEGTHVTKLHLDTWHGALRTVCHEGRKAEKALSTTQADTPLPPEAKAPARPDGAAPPVTKPLAGRDYVRHMVELVRQVAEAAHALHEAGIVHRDIKPGNIIVGLDGDDAVLMDLGLAQLADTLEGRLTRTRQFVGTLRYASPEQVLAVEAVDRRSDVYSLGATLWELLTLRPLYGGTEQVPSPEMMRRIQYEEPDRVRKFHTDIPRDLDAVVLKCLEKNPNRRYASAGELAQDLGRFLAGEPVKARPVGNTERLWRWCKRKPGLAISGGLAALATVAIVILSIWFGISSSRTAQNLEAALEKADREHKLADAHRHQAEKALLKAQLEHTLSEMDRGLILCEQGDAGRGLLWLTRALEGAPQAAGLDGALRANLAAWRRRVNVLRAPLIHPDAVEAAAFSPDGKMVVTGGADNAARLWDAATGKPRGKPLQHPGKGKINAVAFSPDGKTVLTASEDGTARLWDAATGRPLGETLRHQGAILAAAFSPDGKTVLTGSADKTARLWDAATGERRKARLITHTKSVLAVAFSPDGKTIVTASEDHTARLWDAKTGEGVGSPMQHPAEVNAVAFRPDGKAVLTGCGAVNATTGEARLWGPTTGKPLSPPLPHSARVGAVAFAPGGKTLLTASNDKTAQLWDAATGKPVGAPLRHLYAVSAIAFSPDGRLILTGSRDDSARIWEAATGKPIGQPLPHRNWVTAVAFSPDGRTVLTASLDKAARLWELAPGRPLDASFAHGAIVYAVAFSPDGKTVLTAGRDRTARFWDAVTGKPLHHVLEHPDWIWAAAFSPDGKTVLLGGRDGTVRFWDVASGKPAGEHLKHDKAVHAAVFSPDGQTILTGSADKTARLWDAATHQQRGKPFRHDDKVNAVAFAADGRTFLTGSDDATARLWDTRTGEPLQTWTHQSRIMAVALSPDGKTVATGSQNGNVELWDTVSGKGVLTLLHHGPVRSVRFSPDGKTVLTGSYDSTAQLWDAASGKPLGPALSHLGGVFAAAFRADGKKVLTGSEDKTARLWDVPVPLEGSVGQVALWARVVTGLELRETGAVQVLEAEQWQQSRQRLAEMGSGAVKADWTPDWVRTWHQRSGAERERAGDWFAAAWHLDRLLEAEPRDAALHEQRARADAELGRWRAAAAGYAKAIELGGDGWRPWQGRGRAWARLGERGKALQDYGQAIERDPENGSLWLARHLLLADAGSWDKAERNYAQAVEAVKVVRLPTDLGWRDRLHNVPSVYRPEWEAVAADCSGAIDAGGAGWWVWRARGLANAALGKWQSAAEDFARAAKLKPGDWQSEWGVARARAELEQWRGAAAACSRAVELKADDPDLWFLRGLMHTQLRDWKKAADDYKKALDVGGAGVEVWFQLGYARESLHHHVAAIAAYSEALRLNPQSTAALNNRGVAYRNKGEYASALKDYTQALALNKDYALAYRNRGECYVALARTLPDAASDRGATLDAAVADATRLIELDPTDLRGYTTRASAYAAKHMDEEALKDFHTAEQIDADNAFLYNSRGLFHEAAERYDQAIADYGRAAALAPKSPIPLYNRGDAYRKKGAYAEAIADYTRALAIDPKCAYAYNGRGLTYEFKGDYKRAAADYGEAIRINPRYTTAYLNRGDALRKSGALKEALADYDRALKIDPGSAYGYNGRGLTHVALKDPKKAFADFDRAIKANSSSVWAYRNRGELRAWRGEWAKAEADFAKAVEVRPDDRPAWQQLARLRLRAGDVAGYRKACAALLKRFSQTKDPGVANGLAWTCALAPDAVANLGEPVELVEQALADRPGDFNYLNTLGAVLYRAGKFDAAVQRLEEAVAAQGKGGTVWDWLFLAMAHQRLRHAAEAGKWLEQAVRWVKDNAAGKGGRLSWDQQLELDLLRREAEALVRGKAPPKK